MKVLSIFGTRPEAIKLAPIILEFNKYPEIEQTICVTAQHRGLLDQVLELFDFHPNYDLNLMKANQSLKDITVNVLNQLEPVIRKVSPDWILVQGDTTTVMASAMLAYYNRIKIGHVEAGLRTYDIYQPFPEEANRRIAGIVSTLHFAPTETAKSYLRNEGVSEKNIVVTGNTVIDAVKIVSATPFDIETSSLAELPREKETILITSHRRENFGEPLKNICEALVALANKFGDQYQFLFLVHPNPNVRQTVLPILQQSSHITLLDPVNYREMIYLIQNSKIVLTDSGGLQEEGPALKKPVLVLRDKTERPEGIEAGVARLVGTDKETIIREVSRLLLDDHAIVEMIKAKNPYGDGTAAQQIRKAIIEYSE